MIAVSMDEYAWREARKGKFTASEGHRLMANGTGGKISVGAMTYCRQVAAEILTGQEKEVFAAAFEWGRSHELEAFQAYQDKVKLFDQAYYGVTDYCFLSINDFAGASPDFLSDIYGEIKCPQQSEHHVDYFGVKDGATLKAIEPKYYWQIQWGLLASGLEVAHFVSYDPRMLNPKHKVHFAEIYADKVAHMQIQEKIGLAAEELNKLLLNFV